MPMDEQVMNALQDLQKQVSALSAQVALLQRRWQWITSGLLVIVGAVGGPNAVHAVQVIGGGA